MIAVVEVLCAAVVETVGSAVVGHGISYGQVCTSLTLARNKICCIVTEGAYKLINKLTLVRIL